jgi:predicted AAA+ superfamily ATPase
MLPRYLEQAASDDLREKMVFIGGPRQVGKTTLAKEIGRRTAGVRYLNWDDRDDKKSILAGAFAADEELVIFDEIHKYRHWKNLVKGFFDKNRQRYKIIVTGSSRLDVYRKGGDSLLGRYHPYRLHPLSLREALGLKPGLVRPGQALEFEGESKESREALERLMVFGGFPEVFLKGTEKALHRWHNERLDALVREDIRDMENLRDLSAIELLVQLLPGKVGGLFSLNSLREDVSAAHKSVASWVDVLERFYYHFRIRPHQSSLIKSIRKEPKLYLWDWSEVADAGARFENLLAGHLLKFCHWLHDAEGARADLRFIRDADGREIDFLVTADGKPWFGVEAKSSSRGPQRPTLYFQSKLALPFAFQVVREPGVDFIREGVRVISASKFLTALA